MARRKRALLVGADYTGTPLALRGCVNDARCMKDLLLSRYQFPPEQVRLLTDDAGTDPDFLPTPANLRRGVAWLLSGARAGDSLVFFYSGHGTQLPQDGGGGAGSADQEDDGLDEALLLLGGATLRDDVLNGLFAGVPFGARLTAFFDCCHSGSLCDLRYAFRALPGAAGRYDLTCGNACCRAFGGAVAVFSACTDAETSADGAFEGKWVQAPSGAYVYEWSKCNGAFTYCLLRALQDLPATPAPDTHALLSEVTERLRAAACPQTPLFTCSDPALFAAPFAL